MIVPMKKAAVIMQQKDAAEAVGRLRSFGLVHVEHQRVPQSQDLNRLQDDRVLITRALGILAEEEFCPKKEVAAARNIDGDWRQAARHIVDLSKRLDQLKEYSKLLASQIESWQAWGDFEPQAIR
jgi:vacuolar-type H+-ATPase subunit I/STV1